MILMQASIKKIKVKTMSILNMILTISNSGLFNGLSTARPNVLVIMQNKTASSKILLGCFGF